MVTTAKEKRMVYEDFLDHYFYLIQEILRLSEEIVCPKGEGLILRKGQELMVNMIKMYLQLMEMMMDCPNQREMQRIKGLYNNNHNYVRSLILKEIKHLRLQYLQGLKARLERANPSKIRESYCYLAKINLYHYQEMKKKYCEGT